jgi:hypothetical protein
MTARVREAHLGALASEVTTRCACFLETSRAGKKGDLRVAERELRARTCHRLEQNKTFRMSWLERTGR